jgi:hypothetical protein
LGEVKIAHRQIGARCRPGSRRELPVSGS